MGPLEDLLWARLPALRPSLAEVVARESERAIEMDRVLWRLSAYEACAMFMDELFRPALEGLPGTVEAARACCRVLREVVALDEVLGGDYGDALHHMVVGWLYDTYPTQLAAVDPQLPGLVREWFGARGPVAVPGTAVVAVLPVLVREELDRHLHRSSGSVEARRYVRMLRRLVEVDAGLTGRHRGDVATSLRWMTVEPYRPVVAGIDATLLTQL